MNTLLRWSWLPYWVAGVCVSFVLPQPLLWLWLLLSCAAAVAAWLWPQIFWGCLCALCLGLAFGVWRTERVLAQQWPLNEGAQWQTLSLTVLDAPQAEARRVRFQAAAQMPHNGQSHRLLVSDYHKQNWPIGSHWQVQARVRPIIGEVNRVGHNREAWALTNHLSGSATVRKGRQQQPSSGTMTALWQHSRSRVGQTWDAQAAAYPQGVALLQALSVGQRSALSTDDWQTFRALGVSHLVSISGLHVGMFALLAAALVRGLLRWSPWPVARPSVWMSAAAVAAALGYSALAGFAVPTQRALLMMAVLAWGLWRGRRFSAGQVWLLAMAAVLLFDPLSVLSAGFWLSFLLVAALMIAMQGILHLPGWRRFGRAQWAAAVASVVLTAYGFGTVPLLSPLANALAIPWFTLILVPLALLCLLLPWTPLLNVTAMLAQTTSTLLHMAAAHAPQYAPAHAPWVLWLLAVPAVVVLLLPRGLPLRPWAWLVLLIVLSYPAPRPDVGNAHLTVWDVGQGLAVSVQTARHDVLFDTGTAYAAQMQLLPNLQGADIRRLDALVLSHHDHDHDGGADSVRAQLPVRNVWAGQPQAYAYATQACQSGIHWVWDGVWFEWLNLPPASAHNNNDQSCVLRVVAGGKAVLIPGDLGKSGERQLVDRHGEQLYSQILILGHHGSRTSSDVRFVQAVAPEWAVASNGFANGYGHPHEQVRALLRANDVVLLRTDEMGGLQTVLSAQQPIKWQPLAAYRPYWQRKPWAQPPQPAAP